MDRVLESENVHRHNRIVTLQLSSSSGNDKWIITSVSIDYTQHLGKRKEQSDCFEISDLTDQNLSENKGILVTLADGQSNSVGGVELSRVAVQEAQHSFRNEDVENDPSMTLLRIVRRAKDAVEYLNIKNGKTTFIGVSIKENKLLFISIGNSRIYLMRNEGLMQLNREHIFRGDLNTYCESDIQNRKTSNNCTEFKEQYSYMDKSVDFLLDRNTNAIQLCSGNRIVLMSDGAYHSLADYEIEKLIKGIPSEAVNNMRRAIMEKNDPDQDNLTIAVISIR